MDTCRHTQNTDTWAGVAHIDNMGQISRVGDSALHISSTREWREAAAAATAQHSTAQRTNNPTRHAVTDLHTPKKLTGSYVTCATKILANIKIEQLHI